MGIADAARTLGRRLAANPGRGLALALALTTLLRSPYLNGALSSDEGGYLYVARHWSDAGHYLYGPQWVDRPPLLIAIFKVCDLLGGSHVAVRLVALAFALVLVAAAFDIGRTLGGARGAVIAGLATAAIASNPLILGTDLIGDEIGATFVALSTALLLRARAAEWVSMRLVLASGVFASAAFLSKQSALLAFVFAGVLLISQRHLRGFLMFAAGALIPLAVAAVWAWSGPGLHQLIDAVYTFRAHSAHLLWTTDPSGPTVRGLQMVGLIAATGLLAVFVVAFGTPFGERREPVVAALLLVGLAYFVASTIFSLNYYNYYLLAMTPLAALAVGMAMAEGSWLREASLLTTGWLVIGAIVGLFVGPPSLAEQVAVEKAIHNAAHPGDSALVLYGQPNVLEGTGLTTPYPYSWSLPARIKDPNQTLMTDILAGPNAPTWIAEIGDAHDWGYGTQRLDDLLASKYSVAATICGHRIYLLTTAARAVDAAANCS